MDNFSNEDIIKYLVLLESKAWINDFPNYIEHRFDKIYARFNW